MRDQGHSAGNTPELEAEGENTGLPHSWTSTSFGTICRVQGGFAFKSTDYVKTGVPLVRISNLVDGQVRFDSDTVYLPERMLATHANFLLKKGDVLIAMSGATTGKMARFELDIPALLNQRVGRFQLVSEFTCASRFIALVVQQITRRVLKEAYGAAQPNISPAQIERMAVPLPPLPEQHRIVSEIEKHFTRLDAGVASLKRVQAALKRYRASVLKAACEGRLVPTEAELTRKPGCSYISASELRIAKSDSATERSRRRAGRLWGAGHVPELTERERTALPKSWIWSKVRDLGHNPEDTVQVGPMSMRSEDFSENGIPVLNVGCVQWGRFDESKLNFLPRRKAASFKRYTIQPGDVLFTRSGTVGRCAVAQEHQNDWLMTFHLLRVRPDPSKCVPEFLRIVFEGASHIRRQTTGASIGTTRAGFNTNLLAALDVPLPPLTEQQRIVVEVDRCLSIVEEIETIIAGNLKRAERLRQSILHCAFTGNL